MKLLKYVNVVIMMINIGMKQQKEILNVLMENVKMIILYHLHLIVKNVLKHVKVLIFLFYLEINVIKIVIQFLV